MAEQKGKYRAWTIDTNKEVRGCYCRVGDKHYIVNPDAGMAECDCGGHGFAGFVEVRPETVGQYTGRKDTNNIEACQYDRIRFVLECSVCEHECEGVIEWDNASSCWACEMSSWSMALVGIDEFEIIATKPPAHTKEVGGGRAD